MRPRSDLPVTDCGQRSFADAPHAATYYVNSDGVNGAGNSTIPSAIDAIRQPFVTTFASAGAGQKLMVWLNGAPQAVTQPGAVGADTGALGFTIGHREDYPGFGWNGLIGELLVYDRVLAEAELSDLNQQLAAHYAVDSPATSLKEAPTSETDPLDRAFVTELYLSAYSREPAADEVDLALRHLHTLADRREGRTDVLWAVLNSKEFLFQH